jgi:hypothetical protein
MSVHDEFFLLGDEHPILHQDMWVELLQISKCSEATALLGTNKVHW